MTKGLSCCPAGQTLLEVSTWTEVTSPSKPASSAPCEERMQNHAWVILGDRVSSDGSPARTNTAIGSSWMLESLLNCPRPELHARHGAGVANARGVLCTQPPSRRRRRWCTRAAC